MKQQKSDKPEDFFIGWGTKMSIANRRAFIGSGLALMAGTGALGWGLAKAQRPVGPGTWNQGDVREYTGVATAEPYAMLRTTDIDGAPKTALLSCLGKCGVAARIGSYAGQNVTVKGSLIQRGRHAMIAVVDGIDWIAPAGETPQTGLLFPERQPITEISLEGEILDSKCWFGAMRPSEGKVHKSCAALCIRGGIPPAFYARDKAGKSALMIMTDRGWAHGPDLLPLVADPVTIAGNVYRRGEMLFLDAPVSAIRRL